MRRCLTKLHEWGARNCVLLRTEGSGGGPPVLGHGVAGCPMSLRLFTRLPRVGLAFRQGFRGVYEGQAVGSKASKYMSKRGPLVRTMHDTIRIDSGNEQTLLLRSKTLAQPLGIPRWQLCAGDAGPRT